MNNSPFLAPTHQALEALYQLAAGVCQEIITFRPDLLVSLAHSDIGPLHASQVYWAHNQRQSFPPFVRINLGVEKQRVYETWRLANGWSGFDVNYTSTPDFHHYQVWFQQNKRYQAEFQALIGSISQADPQVKRVLILDEISHGNTRAIAFGLLLGIYPDAELRFIAGVQDWTNALGEAWLSTFYPALYQDLQAKKTEESLRHRFPTVLHSALKQIVVGTEDADADTLTFQPIRETNPAVHMLLEQGVSVESSLACSQWTLSQIAAYVAQRLSAQKPPDDGIDRSEPWFQTWPVSPKEKVWIEIWTQNGITVPRWAKIYGMSRSKARADLQKEWQFYQNLQPAGFGAHTRYRVDPGFLPEPPENEVQSMSPFLRLPGDRILAQGYPGQHISYKAIFAERIDEIIDLTTTPAAPETEHYFPNRNPDWFYYCYYESIQEESAEAGRKIAIQNYPIQPYAIPTTPQMVTILDAIDVAVAEGKKILIHDLLGNERAGMVLGCYLIRHGKPARQAIHWLNEQLPHTWIGGYRIPGTEAQYRFVLHWKAGQ